MLEHNIFATPRQLMYSLVNQLPRLLFRNRTLGILVLLAFLAAGLSACSKDKQCRRGNQNINTEGRIVEEFSAIDLRGDYEVYLRLSEEEPQIKIEAESNIIERIETTIEGNSLVLKNTKCIEPNKPVKIFITMNRLDAIKLIGAGSVQTSDTFISSTGKLAIDMQGSGLIDVRINASEVDIKNSGSGKVYVWGSAGYLNLNNTSDGVTNAYGLRVNEADVDMRGKFDQFIYVTDTLWATLRAEANLYYDGSPIVIDTSYSTGITIQR
jgi:hypothetical protein